MLFEECQAQEHWVSAGQLWKACGLSLIEGMVLFQLQHQDYHVDFLRPQTFPFQDVWVPVSKARHMATTLGVIDQLDWFLDNAILASIFSLDIIDTQEMVHNWCLPAIPLSGYSTRALLDFPIFPADLERLEPTRPRSSSRLSTTSSHHSFGSLTSHSKKKKNSWRTQLSQSYQPGMVMKDRLETGLVRWQVWAYDQFLASQVDVLADHPSQSPTSTSPPSPLDPTFPVAAMWDVLQGMACDLQTLQRKYSTAIGKPTATSSASLPPLPPTASQPGLRSARVFSDSMMIGNMPLKPSFLRQSHGLQHLYLSMMLEKMQDTMTRLDMLVPASSAHATRQTIPAFPSAMSISTTSSMPPRPVPSSAINTTPIPLDTHTLISESASPDHPFSHQKAATEAHILLHDRMDTLDQELFRVRRKAKKRTEDVDEKLLDLHQQLMNMDTWKRSFERRLRKERSWLLFINLLLLLYLVFRH
ncbi:hypothetical protein DM01DRAFT_1334120 [Hesseltinella vesiculosa]|uniref:Uncharacterized protein n=1 Tax=Hesseltinella vesiculosa TaxID=101127 RepID=A0A1X2GMZ0_9FUNG|nr:hypothetical protein DM01DRAFT_1334120 [Hesseltinella vesiculosa]